MTNAILQDAVALWCSDRSEALRRFGDISKWDVSQVTSMANLFEERLSFNDDISAWNVSSVTNVFN
jgi:hypothetical protein